MLTLAQMKELKRQLGMTNEDIAEMTGVPLSTVQKVFGGTVRSPRFKTLEALSKPMEKAWQRYRAQDGFTIEDYYRWPEEERVELINGRIYNLAAPTTDHQIIISQIMRQIFRCQDEHGEECLVLQAPVDVQLDRNDQTMVQPDLIMLCDETKNINRCIFGAPDFVVEVLSPSTRSKDTLLKAHKYCDAGCREYWIVDLENEEVIVQDYENERLNIRYTFDDTIPVAISGGKCRIDFTRIRQHLTKHPQWQPER